MEEKIIIMGVDPGKQGYITIWDSVVNDFTFYKMPYHKVEIGELLKSGKPKTKSEFYEEGLKDLVFEIHSKYKGYKIYASMEKVQGREGWSAGNNFSFGHTAGLQKMMLIMLGAEITMVRPQKWQTAMYHGYTIIKKKSESGKTIVHDTKATSKMVAQNICPDIDFRKTERCKELDDNKTDSFLICLYLKNHILKM